MIIKYSIGTLGGPGEAGREVRDEAAAAVWWHERGKSCKAR